MKRTLLLLRAAWSWLTATKQEQTRGSLCPRDLAIYREGFNAGVQRERDKHASQDEINRATRGNWMAEAYRREFEQARVEAVAEHDARERLVEAASVRRPLKWGTR